MSRQFLGFPQAQRQCDAEPVSKEGTPVYWLIGGGCLVIGWLIGYGMGKPDGLRELGRAEFYARQRKVRAYRNRNKKPVQGSRNRNKKR
jgi:hypothetical protein